MARRMNTANCGRLIDLTGKRFGRWRVISKAAYQSGKLMWLCRCDCGTEREVAGGNLRNGKTTSCGCLNAEIVSRQKRRHGRSKWVKQSDPTYNSWCAMKARCNNPKAHKYPSYGARGIKVCERWNASFEAFLADMGERPSKDHSLDRWPDNNGGYEPGNVRWATRIEQGANTRQVVLVKVGDQMMSLSQASKATGLTRETIKRRVREGIPLKPRT